MFYLAILVGDQLCRLGTRLRKLVIASDDLFFIDLESTIASKRPLNFLHLPTYMFVKLVSSGLVLA